VLRKKGNSNRTCIEERVMVYMASTRYPFL